MRWAVVVSETGLVLRGTGARSYLGAVKLLLAASGLVIVLLLLPGCSSSCTYGKGNNGFCRGRGPATAHESTGWHTASLRPRVAVAREKAGPRIVQAKVNQYGELWLYTGETDHVVLDVDGKQIDPKEEDSATGDMPFPSKKVTASAMDKAMEYIQPRAPRYSFISGDLYVGRFGHDKGLWWHIEMYSEAEKNSRHFLATPSGAVRCEHIPTSPQPTFARISGEGCPDQGF